MQLNWKEDHLQGLRLLKPLQKLVLRSLGMWGLPLRPLVFLGDSGLRAKMSLVLSRSFYCFSVSIYFYSVCLFMLRWFVFIQVVETALALQEAGCFSVVLECVPAPVAAAATSALQIPTIGIGAGPFCSGQVNLDYCSFIVSKITACQQRFVWVFVYVYISLLSSEYPRVFHLCMISRLAYDFYNHV